MRASPRSLQFWLIRGVPLAAVALGVALLVPADFNAAANTIAATPAPAPAKVKIDAMLAPPRVIPAGTLNMASSSSIPYVGADAPADQTQVAAVATPDLRPSVQPAALETSAPAVATTAALTTSTVPPTGDKSVARVAYSGVNVRAAAEKGAGKLFVLPPGAPVQTGESINGWVHVYADQGDGWVYKTYLLGGSGAAASSSVQVMSPKPKAEKSPLIGRVVQVASNVTVRDGPSSDSDSIYSLDAGERVKIVEASDGWARIATTDGESGWIRMR